MGWGHPGLRSPLGALGQPRGGGARADWRRGGRARLFCPPPFLPRLNERAKSRRVRCWRQALPVSPSAVTARAAEPAIEVSGDTPGQRARLGPGGFGSAG